MKTLMIKTVLDRTPIALATWLATMVASHATILIVDHHTFNDNTNPDGLTVLGTPTYSAGSLVLDGSSGLTDTATLSATDNFGIEVIATFTGTFPGFSFPLAATDGSNNGWGVVSIGDTVSGHSNGLGGPFGGFTAIIGTEYRFAIVRDAGVATFYVDGVAQLGTLDSERAVPSILTIGYNLLPGEVPEGFLTGSINEVRTFTFEPGEFAASDLLAAPTTGGGGEEFKITEIVNNPDGTVSLKWNSEAAPGTSYRVLYSPDLSKPFSEWQDDDDSVATQGETTTYTTQTSFSEPSMFFAIERN